MELLVITGENPRKIEEFYKQLRFNVQFGHDWQTPRCHRKREIDPGQAEGD